MMAAAVTGALFAVPLLLLVRSGMPSLALPLAGVPGLGHGNGRHWVLTPRPGHPQEAR